MLKITHRNEIHPGIKIITMRLCHSIILFFPLKECLRGRNTILICKRSRKKIDCFRLIRASPFFARDRLRVTSANKEQCQESARKGFGHDSCLALARELVVHYATMRTFACTTKDFTIQYSQKALGFHGALKRRETLVRSD